MKLKPSFGLALLLTTLVAPGPLSTVFLYMVATGLIIPNAVGGVLASYYLLVRRAPASP